MDTKELNITALDAVLTAVLGEDGSRAVATAYQFADDLMFKAHCDGFNEGWKVGYEHGQEIGRADAYMQEAVDAEHEKAELNAVPARFAGQAGFPLYDAVREFMHDEGFAVDANEAVQLANDFWAFWTSRPR